MSKLVQYSGVYFPDLNLNSYEVRFKCLNQARSNLVQKTRAFSLKIRMITSFF